MEKKRRLRAALFLPTKPKKGMMNMADTKCGQRDMVCVDTYRVLDSCRDKDCFEDVRVFLTAPGADVLSRAGAVRAKSAKVVWACIDIDSVPFNRGFCQLLIRIYCRIAAEVCLGQGGSQEIEGIAAVEKKVILYGGEGNVNVFKSELSNAGFCSCGGKPTTAGNTLPIAVLEVVDPIVLDPKVTEAPRPSCCTADEIPERVRAFVSGPLSDGPCALLVSLGFFSVVRIERPAQYLVNAVEYTVPEKECAAPIVEDACSLFRQMAFPVSEFSPSSQTPPVLPGNGGPGGGDCGCAR